MGVVTFMMSFQPGTGVSNFAHLGGLLVGYLWLKKPRGKTAPVNILGPVTDTWRQFRRRRARRKFEVWMRKHGRDLQ